MVKKAALALVLALAGVLGVSAPAWAVSTYHYSGGQETPAVAQTLVSANILVPNPAVAATGEHSLMEITMQAGPSNRDIIGLGWRKNGPSANVELFAECFLNNVYYGAPSTGNCSFWDPNGATGPNLGDNITSAGAKAFNIQYTSGTTCNGGAGIWVYYGGSGVGCFRSSTLGTSPLVTGQGAFFQAYGEVYGPSGTCTDMGNGVTAGGGAAYIASLAHGATNGAFTWNVQTDPSQYGLSVLSARGAYLSGPGWC